MHARINLAVLKLVHILWWKLIVKFLRSTDMYVADLVQGRYVRVRSFGSDHLTICGLWQGFALLPRGWGGEGRGVECSTKSYTGRLLPEVHSLPFYISFLQ